LQINGSGEYIILCTLDTAVDGNFTIDSPYGVGADMYLGKVRKLIDFRFNAKYGWGANGVEDKNYNYKFEPEKYQAFNEVSFYETGGDYDKFYTI